MDLSKPGMHAKPSWHMPNRPRRIWSLPVMLLLSSSMRSVLDVFCKPVCISSVQQLDLEQYSCVRGAIQLPVLVMKTGMGVFSVLLGLFALASVASAGNQTSIFPGAALPCLAEGGTQAPKPSSRQGRLNYRSLGVLTISFRDANPSQRKDATEVAACTAWPAHIHVRHLQ